MGKSRIDELLPCAYDAINSVVAENGIIKGNYKAQITSFGAAISMGSLLAAIAFFSENSKSDIPRDDLMKMIYYLVEKRNYIGVEQIKSKIKSYDLFNYVKNNNNESTKQLVLDAAIAIKLALNLFKEEEKNTEGANAKKEG